MKTKISYMREHIKRFGFKSIFFKNMLVITLSFLIPFLIVSSTIFISIRKTMSNEIELIDKNHVTLVKNSVDSIIKTAENFTVQTSFDEDVDKLLNLRYRPEEYSEIQIRVRKNIYEFLNMHSYVHSVYIYNLSNGVIINNSETTNVDLFKDLQWVELCETMPIDTTTIIPRKYADQYPSFISVIRSVGLGGAKKVGYIVVNIDAEEINKLIAKEKEQKTYVYIVDSQKNILLSSDIKLIGNKYENILDLQPKGNEQPDNYRQYKLPSEKYDITYISVSENSHSQDMVHYSFMYLFFTIILLVVLCIIVPLWLSVKTYNPIHSLLEFFTPQDINDIKKIEGEEIDFITENITKTMKKNEEVSLALENKLLELKSAQISVLQAQISPHFLNNVFDVISWMAIKETGIDNKISKMIRHLSDLFYISLNSENYIIAIEEELKHAEIYVKLIKNIYGNELNVVWKIDEDVLKCQTLKLMLQPILENAVVHGVKPKHGKGTITICVEAVNENINFYISDDGAGMNPETLKTLQRDINDSNNSSSKHIGLKNVNKRIKLLFGEEYGISVESEENVGTKVKVLVPKLQ